MLCEDRPCLYGDAKNRMGYTNKKPESMDFKKSNMQFVGRHLALHGYVLFF